MDTRVDIHSVLADIRNLRSQLQQIEPARPERLERPESLRPDTRVEPGLETSFGDVFESAIDTVNGLQKESGALRNAYVKGDPEIDLAEVMIASQKASVSFQALTQVRNKVVQAYEDIMKMPV